MKQRNLYPKPVLDQQLLRDAFREAGILEKHCQTIWRYIIQKGVMDFNEIPTIPKKALEILKDFTITTSKVIKRTDNSDKSTTKLLIELQDGQRIETVVMRYGDVALNSFPNHQLPKTDDGKLIFKSNKRATVCVSSQVGCAMGCTFCATGTMNLLANLTSGEILEQLYFANQVEKIRNVVFMGMGEPLDNYDQLLNAITAMTDNARFGLSSHRISVSTVGVVPRIKQMKKDLPDVGLALSLHAPTQDLRIKIVPTSKAWHIDKIMNAVHEFIQQQNSKITSYNRKKHCLIEYVLIKDVNDSENVAHDLGKLLENQSVLLNIIPYNPTDVPYDYRPPTQDVIDKFVDIVRNRYNIHTLLRQEFGQDINSACGQLVINSKKCDNGDMEDLVKKPRIAKVTKVSRSKVAKKKSNQIYVYGLLGLLFALLVLRIALAWKQ